MWTPQSLAKRGRETPSEASAITVPPRKTSLIGSYSDAWAMQSAEHRTTATATASSDGADVDQQASQGDAAAVRTHNDSVTGLAIVQHLDADAVQRQPNDRLQSKPSAMSTLETQRDHEHDRRLDRGAHSALSLARYETASTTVVYPPDDRGDSQATSASNDSHPPGQDTGKLPTSPFKKPLRFWLIFSSLMAVTCLTAIDMTIISTTLPTIVRELPRSSISASWVTSSFLLAETAFQPMMGGLADVWGRRNSLVLAVVLFMIGSAISAVADTMLVLVVGRGIQGIGGGGVQAITEIVLSDLTTLRERGIYVGFISLDFAAATFVAPLLGGYFSEHNWRWVFWINMPIGAASLCLIIPTMKLNRPEMPLRDKFERMDVPANMILLGSVVAILIAVTDGGITHPWSSWHIYVPFTLGWVGMFVFFAIELTDNKFAPNPVLPRRLFSNRTAGACFAMTFLHGVVTYGLIYLLPLYFQAQGSSPMRSAVEIFPATAPSPFSAMVAGALMVWTGKYRMQMWFWWSLITLGCGLTILLGLGTPTWKWVLIQIVPGLGIGALFTLSLPPIQASLPVDELAHAVATFAFCRSFGSVWGIALGTNVFISVVNGRLNKLPQLREIGLTGATALGAVDSLGKLPPPLIVPTREAYMHALRMACIAFIPVSAVGLLVSLLVKDLPLPDLNESKHGMRDKPSKSRPESMQGDADMADHESHMMMPPLAPQSSFTAFEATSRDTLVRLRAPEPENDTSYPPPPAPTPCYKVASQ